MAWWPSLNVWEKLQVILFQSITTRTAGFNTVTLSISTLSDAGLLLMIALMFIGASPGSTGGVSTAQAFTFVEKLFTCMSAFATVGLDVGVTANLSRWGQLMLIVGMVMGRLGVILLLSALYGRRPPSRSATRARTC